MFGMKGAPASRRNDEAEKPFWISYADLMTAMMVLFLVVMVASLASVTQRIREVEAGEKQEGRILPVSVKAWRYWRERRATSLKLTVVTTGLALGRPVALVTTNIF